MAWKPSGLFASNSIEINQGSGSAEVIKLLEKYSGNDSVVKAFFNRLSGFLDDAHKMAQEKKSKDTKYETLIDNFASEFLTKYKGIEMINEEEIVDKIIPLLNSFFDHTKTDSMSSEYAKVFTEMSRKVTSTNAEVLTAFEEDKALLAEPDPVTTNQGGEGLPINNEDEMEGSWYLAEDTSKQIDSFAQLQSETLANIKNFERESFEKIYSQIFYIIQNLNELNKAYPENSELKTEITDFLEQLNVHAKNQKNQKPIEFAKDLKVVMSETQRFKLDKKVTNTINALNLKTPKSFANLPEQFSNLRSMLDEYIDINKNK